jgi:hypothetical protein
MTWTLLGLALLGAPQNPLEPIHQRMTVQSDPDTGRYEGLYGKPEFWSLELLTPILGEPGGLTSVPSNKSIRTQGKLFVVARPHPDPPQCELCVDEKRHCFSLANPVPEISDAFWIEAPSRRGDEMDIVGAFTDKGFIFWSFVSAPPREKSAASGGVPLESLVKGPDRYQGRTIVVRGSFRGRNLFGDMPAGSARDRSDWVLRDGPFFIWVTGKAPKGAGFALSLDRPSDATYRLEVEGRPERKGGLVYLRAQGVRLLGRTSEPAN